MFDDSYRPSTIGSRMQQAPFPKDPFGTVRADPDQDRYAMRVNRNGRLRWFIVCLNMPHDPADLRADNLHEWPIVFTPTTASKELTA